MTSTLSAVSVFSDSSSPHDCASSSAAGPQNNFTTTTMSKSEEQTIDVKLFVDQEKGRVLFAESGKDFVDALFSFLTLPLGTVARVLGKQSQVGCLDDVYSSVEGLGADYFRTKACKTMLLAPFNSSYDHCSRLKVRVDDGQNPRAVYVCKDTNCCARGDSAFSSVPDTICKCGKVMKYSGDRPEKDVKVDLASMALEPGVFVKGVFHFIITDDLRVAPSSTSLMLALLEEFGVGDVANLEQRTIQLTSEKITSLLKRSLTSKQPLTGLCFDVPLSYDDVAQYVLPENMHPEQGNDAEHTQESVKIKVLQTKNNSSLLYAEVGDDFVDLLFGLLSIPLGSIMKACGKCGSNGCVDNLYSSIDGSARGCIPECQILLLSPKLSPFFCCGATKILQVDELAPGREEVNTCFKCFKINGFWNLSYCHGYKRCRNCYYFNCASVKSTNLREWDPRSPKDGSDNREAYVKQGPQTFMVTDNLQVLPLCLAGTLQAVAEAKIQRTDLVEKEYTLTNSQVMELLKAALVTRKALSSVLLPPENKKLRHYRSRLY